MRKCYLTVVKKMFALTYSILGDFCSILRGNSYPLSFQCSQPLYIPLHFSFSLFQRRENNVERMIAVFLHEESWTKTFNPKQPFSRLPISERVEMIAPTLLKAILEFCTTNQLLNK